MNHRLFLVHLLKDMSVAFRFGQLWTKLLETSMYRFSWDILLFKHSCSYPQYTIIGDLYFCFWEMSVHILFISSFLVKQALYHLSHTSSPVPSFLNLWCGHLEDPSFVQNSGTNETCNCLAVTGRCFPTTLPLGGPWDLLEWILSLGWSPLIFTMDCLCLVMSHLISCFKTATILVYGIAFNS
jgi:hypothetical protein